MTDPHPLVFEKNQKPGVGGRVFSFDRSHALRGNEFRDALRQLPEAERGAPLATFPRRSVGTIDLFVLPYNASPYAAAKLLRVHHLMRVRVIEFCEIYLKHPIAKAFTQGA
jgi:hypothetical protein